MPRNKSSDKTIKYSVPGHATTPEGEYSELGSMALQCARERIANGSASNQLLLYFLEKNDEKKSLEIEKLRSEISMIKAKEKAYDMAEQSEKRYAEAIAAMKIYSGEATNDENV